MRQVSFWKSLCRSCASSCALWDIEIVIGDNAADLAPGKMTLRLAKDNPGKISIWQNRCPLTRLRTESRLFKCTRKTEAPSSRRPLCKHLRNDSRSDEGGYLVSVSPYSPILQPLPAIRPITAKPRGKTPQPASVFNHNYRAISARMFKSSVFVQTVLILSLLFRTTLPEDDSWDIALNGLCGTLSGTYEPM